jgi:hypothetical protein
MSSEKLDFLDAIFAADPEVSLNLVVDDQNVTYSGGDLPTSKTLYVSPKTEKGYAFAWRFCSVGDTNHKIKPTAMLTKGMKAIAFYAYKELASEVDATQAATYIGMQTPDESAPLPGTDGWSLDYVDIQACTTPQDVQAGFLLHAVVMTPLDPAISETDITLSIGAGAESKNWRSKKMRINQLVSTLCNHKIGPKDGQAIVMADMIDGERRKNSVKEITGAGLDIDTVMPSDLIDAKLEAFGYHCVRYATHSHGKTVTEFKKDKVQQFIVKHGAGKDPETTETIRWFLENSEAWHPDLIATAEYSKTEHTKKGIVIVVTHAPIHKNRIIIPLAKPYKIAEEGVTQKAAMDKWATVIEKIAGHIVVPFDKSCTDPCRLFYLPRHDEGKPFSVSVFGGPLFDWNSVMVQSEFDKIADAVDDKGKSKSVTEEGRKLGRWWMKRGHGFLMEDVIKDHCPEKIRSAASNGSNCECPFDEDHSNAGDEEDQAFFVVNAAEGPNEGYTAFCHHETCKDKTALDHLGKMIKDGWFPAEILEDEAYNAILDEEAIAEKSEPVQKMIKQDKAKLSLDERIELLTLGDDQGTIEVFEMMVTAGLNDMAKDRFFYAVIAKTEAKIGTLRKIYAKVAKRLNVQAAEKANKGKKSQKSGKVVFAHNGSYDLEEAATACVKAMKNKNHEDRVPTYCCVGERAARLRVYTDFEGCMRVEVQEYERETRFWSDMCAIVTFQVTKEDGTGMEEKVPEDVARHVMAQAWRWLPQAPEVLYTPVFLKDGSRMEKHGYHYDIENGTNILLICNDLDMKPVSDMPTREEAQEAIRWIKLELLSDFPFWDIDKEGIERREISEWNAVGMMLTPFVRRMIKGRTPVFFIEKPSAGTGGTLLGQMPMWLFDGKAGDVTTYSQSEEEMTKALLAAARENRSHLFFDDVTDFNNRVLLRALTQANVAGRLLGGNKNFSIPNNFNWISTGNNTTINIEMRRRCKFVRLNANTAEVSKRTFRHPDVSGLDYNVFVLEHRAEIIHHIMTVVQYWISIGKPEYRGETRQASFEAWERVIGGILLAIGAENFFGEVGEVDVDAGEAAINQFMSEFYRKNGAERSVSGTECFDMASNSALDIISGSNDDQKRVRFQRSIAMMKNRTFKFKDQNYRFAQKVAEDHTISYSLVKVVPKKATA